MYNFRPVTERMHEMKRCVRERIFHIDSECCRIITEANKKYESVIPVIRNALLFKAMCEEMTTRVEPHEVLVSNNTRFFCGPRLDPRWGGGMMYVMLADQGVWKLGEDGLYHNPDTDELRFVMDPEDCEALREMGKYWKGRTVGEMAAAWQPEGFDEICRLGVRSFGEGMPLVMMPAGHSTPGYKKLLTRGYASIRDEARSWMDAHRNDLMGDDVNKYMFYQSVEIVCEGAITMLKRYGQACLDAAAECTDPERKAELEGMSEDLMWISENPVKTFRQACQATLLYVKMLTMSGMTDIGSFGRFDQYTWPYLEKDLEEGRLTMDQAQEITDCFFMKINNFYNGGVGPLTAIIGIGNTYLHTTIGGIDPDTGEDATNPVTFMTLESVGRLTLHDPTISLRVSSKTPDELWNLAFEVNRLVGGLPLFQNDDVIVPSIVKELGFTLRDARDYALIGCQEITGSGNDYAAGNGTNPPEAYTYYSAILDMAMYDGMNPYNHEQCCIHTGYLYEMESIEELQEAWKKLATYVLRAQVSVENYVEEIFMHYDTHPILSITMEGCMETGVDVVCGGAKYNSYGCTAVGLATVADSLTAIKYLCFDKKTVTTREFYDAVMANWEGHEDLRQIVRNQVPHYGNADPYADEMMAWVVSTYREMCEGCYSRRSRIFKGGMYGAADHVAQGYTTWATPDGRFAGEPIADAASPAQGRDTNGPTSVLNSALAFDHTRFMNGMALNIRIHPSALQREDGVDKLRSMTKAFMEDGGMEVQYNIVSADTMRAAQEDPDAYNELVVRIAGFSAYFVELNQDCQNDLISRTENML